MDVLNKFTAVGLADIGKANFMNRVDTKFPLRSEVLWQNILPEITDDYYIVEINGLRMMEYRTVYFDTPDNMFYTTHHNGKLDRFKVRKRLYVDTGTAFLEIKHKNNKGKTKKKRIEIQSPLDVILPEEYDFVAQHAPCKPELLKPVIENHFRRITLVKKDLCERCTIDCDLSFADSEVNHSTDHFAMVELKHEAGAPKSPLRKTLYKYGVHQSGFSKYCIGRVLNGQKDLKTNLFRVRIRMLQKRLDNALGVMFNA